ncbi:MAG TPA: hypothetical protein VMZ27_07140 [Candidatus Saccharimonadales bacterium]|nr:hypothetical protein [Candidatus Saccharimonadales bacterium]
MLLSKSPFFLPLRALAAALLVLCLLRLLASPCVAAETAQLGAKFLLVVDTSTAMKRFDHAGRQTVFDFIFSGASTQMHSGDTFGLWTFNDQVSAGAFPMQVWTPDSNLNLATAAGLFLKGQHYEGNARADKAIEKALALVKSVKDLNIFIVTSGDSSLGNSDIEKGIKDVYQAKSLDARKRNLPVVLWISAWKGEVVNVQVAISGEAVQFPADLLAKARERVKSPAPTQVANANQPGPAKVRPKPIIMIREKPAPKPLEAASNQTQISQQQPSPAAQSPVAPRQSQSATVVPQVSAARPEPPPAQLSDLLPSPLKVSAREPQAESSAPGPKTIAPPAIAMSVPTSRGVSSAWVMFAGFVFFAMSLTVAGWTLYRIRTSRQASFISQSMARR